MFQKNWRQLINFDQKKKKNISCIIFQFLVIKALDPDPDPETYPDSLEIRYPDSDPVPKILKTAKSMAFLIFSYISQLCYYA